MDAKLEFINQQSKGKITACKTPDHNTPLKS